MRKGPNETQPQMKNRDNNYTTYKSAFDLLFKYIDVKDKKIWFPFYDTGAINTYKFECDIIHDDSDFFHTDIDFDYLIDNPPYTIKQKIIERCIQLNKPFALLLPIDTLERKYISKLFKDRDFTIIIPTNRYDFINNNKKITPPFKCCWFCIGFGLETNIIFE
tara:strand:+ start:1959 stop:2447 length:489 start_codon:yes stop_codon:yes gene_type:complete